MKIVAAADHGGFEMKNQIVEDLRKQGFAVEDLGTNSADSVDYPDFAEKCDGKSAGWTSGFGHIGLRHRNRHFNCRQPA